MAPKSSAYKLSMKPKRGTPSLPVRRDKKNLKKKQIRPGLGPSHGAAIKLQGRELGKIRIPPPIWKLACADAPTRSTSDYSRMSVAYKENTAASASTLPDNFSDVTLFMYMPGFAPHQFIALNTSTPLGSISPAQKDRDVPNSDYQYQPIAMPNLFMSTPQQERSCITSAALTLATKFPGSSGQLNIRRITSADNNTTFAALAVSLKEDMVSTYHLPLTGNQRWNMHCGIHNSPSYGEFNREAVNNYFFGSKTAVGGLIFSVTNVLTGAAIASPGLQICAGAQWTQELSTTTAHTKDQAPIRTVGAAKDLHSHQAQTGPFDTNPAHPEKASVGILNALHHGVDNMRRGMEEAGALGESALGLVAATTNSASVMQRGMALAAPLF